MQEILCSILTLFPVAMLTNVFGVCFLAREFRYKACSFWTLFAVM